MCKKLRPPFRVIVQFERSQVGPVQNITLKMNISVIVCENQLKTHQLNYEHIIISSI